MRLILSCIFLWSFFLVLYAAEDPQGKKEESGDEIILPAIYVRNPLFVERSMFNLNGREKEPNQLIGSSKVGFVREEEIRRDQIFSPRK